jgi:hypothetical protein
MQGRRRDENNTSNYRNFCIADDGIGRLCGFYISIPFAEGDKRHFCAGKWLRLLFVFSEYQGVINEMVSAMERMGSVKARSRGA